MAFKSFSVPVVPVPSGTFVFTSAVGGSSSAHGSSAGDGAVSVSGTSVSTGSGSFATAVATGHDASISSASHAGDTFGDHVTVTVTHSGDGFFHF